MPSQVHSDPAVNSDICQKAEWRVRLLQNILCGAFGREIVADLIEAALSQAYQEGMMDAQSICQTVADKAPRSGDRRVASILANSISELAILNRKTHA